MGDVDFADARGRLHRHDTFNTIAGTPWYADAVYERFSRQEYDRRFRATHEKMARLGLDALIAPGGPNHWSFGGGMRWLTNHWEWHGVAAYAVVPRDEEPVLVCGPGGAHREAIRRATPVRHVRESGRGRFGRTIAEVLAERGLERGTIGHSFVDPFFESSMPANDLQALHDGLPDAEIRSVGDFFHELVHRKSDEEIECVRRAGELMDRAMEAMIERARPGATEYQLAAAAAHAIMDGGGQVDFLIIGSTPTSAPGLVFGNPWPSGRALRDGDIVINELACSYRGYTVQIGTPICVGEPPSWVRSFFADVLEGFDRMAAELRPGKTWEDVREAGRYYAERGYDSRPLLLHCIDFVTHTPQVLVEGVRADDGDEQIVPRVLAMLEPTVINAEGTFGMFLGRSYVITEDGHDQVTKFPTELVLN